MCPTDHAHRHLGDGVSDVVVEVEGLLLDMLLEFTRYGYRATSGSRRERRVEQDIVKEFADT